MRNEQGRIILGLCSGLGIATNFMAEIKDIIRGTQMAQHEGHQHLWVTSDFKASIRTLEKGNIPWVLQEEWLGIKRANNQVRFSHAHRKVSFAADQLAKKGSCLNQNETRHFRVKPRWIRLEDNSKSYFRFEMDA